MIGREVRPVQLPEAPPSVAVESAELRCHRPVESFQKDPALTYWRITLYSSFESMAIPPPSPCGASEPRWLAPEAQIAVVLAAAVDLRVGVQPLADE